MPRSFDYNPKGRSATRDIKSTYELSDAIPSCSWNHITAHYNKSDCPKQVWTTQKSINLRSFQGGLSFSAKLSLPEALMPPCEVSAKKEWYQDGGRKRRWGGTNDQRTCIRIIPSFTQKIAKKNF